MGLVEPKPTYTNIRVTLGTFDTLSSLAEEYHTDVNSIAKANGITNPDKLKNGQVITFKGVTKENWAKYKKEYNKYCEELDRERTRIEVQNRSIVAQQKIDKAKRNSKLNDKYTFSIDKNGYMIVTLKKDMELEDIRKDFKLPGGHLLEQNPKIKNSPDKYPVETRFSFSRFVNVKDWDGIDVKKGDSFKMDPDDVLNERSFEIHW